MPATKTISITLPENVWADAVALAEKKSLSLEDVVSDAIVIYRRTQSLNELMAYGREQAAASEYREEDVVRLCREARAELAAERRSEAGAKRKV